MCDVITFWVVIDLRGFKKLKKGQKYFVVLGEALNISGFLMNAIRTNFTITNSKIVLDPKIDNKA